MMTKKKKGKRRQYSRMGKRSAAKLTPEQRSERARRAAEARYRPMHDERLLIYREGKLVGVLDVARATLNSDDADLQVQYRQACDPGVPSLGRMDTPHKPGGPIIEEMNWTKLLPGSLEGMYAFKRELEGKGYRAEVTTIVKPKPGGPSPRFIADHFFTIPIEPKQK